MANALYDKARKAFADGNIALLTDDITVVLVDTAAYTVDLVNDEFLDAIPVGDRIATATLTGKDTTAGVFDADNAIFSAVTGDVSEALVLVQDTGVAATSRLIAYIDNATGLPATPDGGDKTVTWSDGVDKIFKL